MEIKTLLQGINDIKGIWLLDSFWGKNMEIVNYLFEKMKETSKKEDIDDHQYERLHSVWGDGTWHNKYWTYLDELD